MSVVAAAVIGSTVVGGYSSYKAGKEQRKGVEKGLEQSSDISQQARQDVLSLFDRSAQSARMGSKGAFDFYKRVAPERMAPYLQGNEQARQAVTIGAQQANNAILGQPVDMQAINQPGVQPDMGYLEEAEMPDYESAEVMRQEAMQQEQSQTPAPNVNIGAQRGGGSITLPKRYREGGADELDKKYRDSPSLLPERYRS